MKKIVFALSLFISTISFGQTIRTSPMPGFQQFGTPSTWTRINGIIYPAVGYAPAIYVDTATANLNPYASLIPFFRISTSSDGKSWVRNLAATKWLEEINSGTSGIGTVTSISQGYGILNTPNPIISTGSVKVDTAILFPVIRSTVPTSPLQAVTDVGNTTTNRIGLGLTSGIIGKIHVRTDNIQTTQTDSTGIYLENSTAATNGVRVQNTPAIGFSTSVWKTGGGSGSKPQLWRLDVAPVSGTFVSSVFQFSANNSNAGYGIPLSISSGGALEVNQVSSGVTTQGIGTINGMVVTNQSPAGSVIIGGGIHGNFSAVAVGASALGAGTNTFFETAVGFSALTADTSGSFNTAIGYNSMLRNLSANSNTAVGATSLSNNLTGDKNTAIGGGALENNTTGFQNAFVGEDAGLHNVSGVNNNGIGWLAGSLDSLGNYNNYFGTSTGRSLSNGSYNVFIGHETGYTGQQDSVSNSIGLGTRANTKASNQFLISDSITRLTFKGVSRGTANYVLTDSLGTGQYWVARPIGAATSVPLSGITAPTGDNIIAMGGFKFGLTGGNVGIGVSPSYRLDVLENASGVFAANVYNSNSNGAGMAVSVNNSVVNRTVFQVLSGAAGSTSQFEITADGKIKMPTLTAAVGNKALRWNSSTGQITVADTTTGGSSGLTVGTTTITSGTNTRVLYNNSGVLGEYAVTGSGTTAVLQTSPTINENLNISNTIGGASVIATTSSSTSYGGFKGVNNSGGYFELFKTSGSYSTYKNVVANDVGFYTATGNFSFLNDAGNFGIAVNGHSTNDFLINTSGVITMSHYGAGAATFDASGNISSVSDERMKYIKGDYRVGLKEVMNIRPILYKWRKESGMETEHTYPGFSAQNIEESLGSLATGTNSQGYKSIQDRAIMAALVNAVQAQQKEIEMLTNEIKKLKRK